VDEEIGQLRGRLRVPHPEHAPDKLIAGTAPIQDEIVVMRNMDDFAGTGARVLNSFKG
jgi:predicted nucleic acid-binding protein